jgi:CheY-like chemotaxis protein
MKIKKIITTQNIKSLPDKKESFLDRADIIIFPVSSNKEVLEIHRLERADLIIANLDEDAINGKQLCSAIREDKELRNVSLIITHSKGTNDIPEMSGCRANALIDISADPSILLSKAHQLLNIPVRETFRAPIFVKVKQDSKMDPSLGYSENISITGMLFDSEKTIVKGEIILCKFVLPDSIHIRTEAEVVRYSDKGVENATNQYGIRFIDLTDRFRTAIENYIRKKQ